MLSPFGEWVREFRQTKQISLREMARKTEITPSFLSAVELGRKSAPANLYGLICAKYDLTQLEAQELKKSLESSKSRAEIRFAGSSDTNDREVAMLFARNFEGMSAEKKEKIRKLLEDNDERPEY